MSSLPGRAQKYAKQAHVGQLRKYTREPYINHPAEVVELVRTVPYTEAMLAAAWLHDIVEDTPIQLDEIERVFGSEVASLVDSLTDISKPSDGNRKTRKALDLEHTAKASSAAKTIKLADLISNSLSIATHDPKFAKVYLPEKAALLEVLTEGNSSLLAKAKELLNVLARQETS